MADLSVHIGKLKLKNPVMVASGTFGYAEEFKDFMSLNKLGAIVTKTITFKPRRGNPTPRTCETPAGMINSIGLENPGIEVFLKEKLPALAKIGAPLIVSVSSDDDPAEFVELAGRLDAIKEVGALELNISCPNLQKERLIAQDPKATYAAVKSVRSATQKTIITKLSPNVCDIAEIARAAEDAGTDAVALVNTFVAMRIDINARRPMVAAITGGLSGPAIRPIAVRMVREAYRKIKVPIIGIGGIMDISSALEFFIAGASVVQIGTANFINPKVSIEIIDGVKEYMTRNKIKDLSCLIGSLKA